MYIHTYTVLYEIINFVYYIQICTKNCYCISLFPQVPLPVVDLQSLIEQCTRELQCSSVCGRGSSRSRSSESGRTDCEQTDLATSDDVV